MATDGQLRAGYSKRNEPVRRVVNVVLMGAVLITSFCGAARLHAGTIRHDVSDSQYTNRAMQIPFTQSLGGLAVRYQGQSTFNFRGGAVLVNNSNENGAYILGAFHELDVPNIAEIQYRLGFDLVNPTETIGINISSIVPHPLYDPNDAPGFGHDLFVAELQNLSTTSNAIPLFMGDAFVGMHTESAGYGKHGTGFTGGTLFDGKMRSWENSLEGLAGSHLLVGPHHAYSRFVPPGSGNLPFEGGSAEFDSGSIVAVNNGGQWELLGIQQATSGNGLYWSLNISRLIDGQDRVWVQQEAHIPEPASLLLFSLGISVLFRRRHLSRWPQVR